MTSVNTTQQYTIGGIGFTINLLCPLFAFDSKGGSAYFSSSHSNTSEWTINFDLAEGINRNELKEVFTGADQFKTDIPYKWSIIRNQDREGLFIEFEDHPAIQEVLAHINTRQRTIEVSILPQQQQTITFDPFFHPLGILLLQYIVHQFGGFVIHASTVEYNNKGYLFSAVSGTGKSTIAELWQQHGATIINDDRLIILPDGDSFRAWNTPMPYYQDRCKSVKLHKAFLIKQSPHNYLEQLPVIKGTLGLLGNCMQFQYDASQVHNRLDALQSIAENCGIYECGFKPDNEIVELILKDLG